MADEKTLIAATGMLIADNQNGVRGIFMSRQRVILVTVGILLSLLLASMEGTVVATAMPTIVSHLGGLAIYSWVFSAFMLASTTTMPVFGKLSDLYCRRPVYAMDMGLFLLGLVFVCQW